jgi:hypothetical protein
MAQHQMAPHMAPTLAQMPPQMAPPPAWNYPAAPPATQRVGPPSRGVLRRPAVIAAVGIACVLIGVAVWRIAAPSSSSEASPAPQVAVAPATPTKPDVVTPAKAAVTPPTTPAVAPTKPDDTAAKPDVAPTKPDVTPAKPDVAPTKPDVAPTKPDVAPTKPDVAPTKPDVTPTKPDEPKPRPVVAALRLEAPEAGQITVLLRGQRTVRKGETLFQISRVTGDPVKIKELTAKLAKATEMAKEDSMYEPFVTEARQELDSVRKVVQTAIKAPRAGIAHPYVRAGASVHAGQLLAEIQ